MVLLDGPGNDQSFFLSEGATDLIWNNCIWPVKTWISDGISVTAWVIGNDVTKLKFY